MKSILPVLIGVILLGSMSPAAVLKKSAGNKKTPVATTKAPLPAEKPAVKAPVLQLSENPACTDLALHLHEKLLVSGYRILTSDLKIAKDKFDVLAKEVSMRRSWGRAKSENININGSMDFLGQQACYSLQKYCGKELDQDLESLLTDNFTTKEHRELEKCYHEMEKHHLLFQVNFFSIDLAKKCAQKSEIVRKMECLEFGNYCTPKELETIQAHKTWDQVEKMKKDAQSEVDRLEVLLKEELDQLSTLHISEASFADDRDWYTYSITPPGNLKQIRKLKLLKNQVESYLNAKKSVQGGALAYPGMKFICESSSSNSTPKSSKEAPTTTPQGIQ